MALTDKQMEVVSEALLPLFQYLETQVIIDVANRIKETMSLTRTSELMAESMQRLGYSPAKIRAEAMKLLKADEEFQKVVSENTMAHKKKVKELLEGIIEEATKKNNTLMADCGDLSYFDDLRTWEQHGKQITDNSYLPQLVEGIQKQTAETFKNLSNTTGFKTMAGFEAMENLYRRELDKAMIKICTGTFSREQVIYETVHSLAESGLRTIDYASGRSMQLDTAVKLAVRTGCQQISAKVMDTNIANTGENLIYVSQHWGARNKGEGHANHKEWQGKVYYIKAGQDYNAESKRIGQDSITDLWEATGYSADGAHENDPLGLHGFNCRHKHYAWFEGISNFPDEDPEPKPVTVDGKEYDYYALTQKQRAMERSVRALKREREAMMKLEMDTKDITKRIRRKMSEYEDFCKKAKVKPDINRMRYEPGTSDLKKTKAWKKYGEIKKESEFKRITLGAADAKGNESEPILIGQIDTTMKGDAIKYFSEEIRNSDIEHLYVIDKKGNVYYNEGNEDSVSIGSLDLTDCMILHNHPKSNGLISFGEDDFYVIRNSGVSEWYLVNEQYDYFVKKIKSMDELAYNPYYLKALGIADITEDIQHSVFECLREEGYVEYVRKEVNKKSTGQD